MKPNNTLVLSAAVAASLAAGGIFFQGRQALAQDEGGSAADAELERAFRALEDAKVDRVQEAADEARAALEDGAAPGDLPAQAREAAERAAAELVGEEAVESVSEAGDALEARAREALADRDGAAGGEEEAAPGEEAGASPGVPTDVPTEVAPPGPIFVTRGDDPNAAPRPGLFPDTDPSEVPAGSIVVTTGNNGESYFDASARVITFQGNVEVAHPQFDLTCDELELVLAPPDAEGAGGGEAAAGEGEGASGALPEGGNSIKTAIARGRRVQIVKEGEEPDQLQVAQCSHAVYDGATGDVILRDWAQVQQGPHLVIGTAQSTVITLRQNGHHDVDGPSETRIVKEREKSEFQPNNPSAAETAG